MCLDHYASSRMCCFKFFFFQAEDGIRELVRSRGLGDVYKRQAKITQHKFVQKITLPLKSGISDLFKRGTFSAMFLIGILNGCLLYTSDAADERSSVDLGGRRIIKKKKRQQDEAQRSVKGSTNTSHDEKRTG